MTLTISSATANTSAAPVTISAPALRMPVVETDAGAGAALDNHLVPVMHQFADATGDETDAVFVGLHLFRNPDQHRSPLVSARTFYKGARVAK